MHSNLRLYIGLLAIVIVITCSAAVALTQQQSPPGPAPSEVNPPQTPSEVPSTGDQGYTRQNPNNINTPPPIRAETYGESHVISWSSLIFGFIVGVGLGYLIGRQRGTTEIRHQDRAA
jgi:hypothetical protein